MQKAVMEKAMMEKAMMEREASARPAPRGELAIILMGTLTLAYIVALPILTLMIIIGGAANGQNISLVPLASLVTTPIALIGFGWWRVIRRLPQA